MMDLSAEIHITMGYFLVLAIPAFGIWALALGWLVSRVVLLAIGAARFLADAYRQCGE